jgi:pyruvate dehydrogenase E2 component (dihydrolipoamide acetyltransferase)
MAFNILMPAGGQNTAESVITRWVVREGDRVKRGDALFQIETDKAAMDVESFAEGVVLKILFQEGSSVASGVTVAIVGEMGEMPSADSVAEKTAADDEYRPIMRNTKQAKQEKDAIRAMPSARKLARENGLSIAELYGEFGRLIKSADVRKKLAYGSIPDDGEEYETIQPSAIRGVIARRTLESAREAPQFTITIKPDMTSFLAFLTQIKDVHGDGEPHISFNDLLMLCSARAAAATPFIRGIYSDEIRIYKHVNIGLAVALSDGLVIPVIRRADTSPLRELAQRRKELVDKARSGGLKQRDMEGGNITLSNMGMFGIDSFTALVNRPESTILAVGAINETLTRVNGEAEWRSTVNITASFDHRLIDGAVGARFMADLKKYIENPAAALI